MKKETLFDLIITQIQTYHKDVLNIYVYGSLCYGTMNIKSDIDIIALVDDVYITNKEIEKEFVINDIDIHCRYIHVQDFINQLNDFSDHVILEAFYSPIKLKETYKINFKITENEYPKLRRIVSHTSSNSFCKAFKKLKQDDTYIGLKSLLHSIRIPILFLQLAKNEKPDFKMFDKNRSIKNLYDEIFMDFYLLDLSEFKEKYKTLRNQVMTEFRKIVGKD